ncbi:glutathione S-transferase family protein [Comamonas sp. NLF-1-9]|uniref:glutathione S-transferase family protein n=1 Tax=Comamonas sp. NLF-1-9 TaxID=2853163 RepID=UPI001C43EBC7|nr:glutathione S-transferase family protein [Comamonas sp. NLF-1-9]QXL83790.1 glutathione S-transferase family protein [Comamonas sp. NLF-1-9]
MLLFDALSPAPRCLRMFLLEKGLTLPTQQVDVFAGDNRQPPYLAHNPAGQTPALLLDDGSCIAESVAIMEYLEELQPLPALIGRTPEERARTRQWQRRVELNITENIHNAFHWAEGAARFAGRIPVEPAAAPGLKRVAQDRLSWLDAMLPAGQPWLAGERLSIADIWLYVWLDFAQSVKQPFDRALSRIGPWFERVAARPSASASLHADCKPGGVRG